MSFLSDFAKGFLATIIVVGIFNTHLILVVLNHAQLTLVFLTVLLIPSSIILNTHLNHRTNHVDKLTRVLVSFNGVSLACWVFDVTSTYYAIDILRQFAEQNPLGWPFGALGALMFYIPTFAFSYLLLFRIKQKVSRFAAVFLTLLAVFMGFMNLGAGLQNFGCSSVYIAVLLEIVFVLLLLNVNISWQKRLRLHNPLKKKDQESAQDSAYRFSVF